MTSSTSSITINPVASFTIPEGTLRRRLRGELESIRNLCRNSGLSDEMTVQIQEWEENFTGDLRFSDETRVCQAYIESLQELLCDPITDTPFDPLAVIGSDNETYGLMSLAVWRLSVPEEYRNRSPLDPENPAPFTVRPHPCVRHMVRWLESHQALFQSEALVSEYLRLLPQPPEENLQDRMNRLIARQRQSEQTAAQQLNQQTVALDRQILDRLNRIDAEENTVVEGLSVRVRGVAAPLIEAQGEVDRAQEEEALSLETLQERIEVAVRRRFEALAQGIDAFARDTGAELGTLEERDRQSMAALQQRIITLESQVTELTNSIESLQENVERVQSLSEILQQEAKDLQTSIDDVKKAIKKRKIKRLQKTLKTVAIVGAAVFASRAAVHYDLLPEGVSFLAKGSSSGGSVGIGFTL